jgi:hypothetical protein
MPLSPAALQRIRDRHIRYGAMLQTRIKALVTRCDAAESLPSWEAWVVELAEIEREAARLRERTGRHEDRAARWLKRVLREPEALAPGKQH